MVVLQDHLQTKQKRGEWEIVWEIWGAPGWGRKTPHLLRIHRGRGGGGGASWNSEAARMHRAVLLGSLSQPGIVGWDINQARDSNSPTSRASLAMAVQRSPAAGDWVPTLWRRERGVLGKEDLFLHNNFMSAHMSGRNMSLSGPPPVPHLCLLGKCSQVKAPLLSKPQPCGI